MSRLHPYVQLIQWAEDYTYKNMDKIVCTLPLAEPHMKAHGLQAGKFIYIPNGIAVDDWSEEPGELPQEYQELFLKLKNEKRFIVGYMGSHGPSNALDILVEAAERLQNTAVDIVLVGQGSEKEKLIEQARSRNLTNIHFLPSIARKYVRSILALVDACYIGWNPHPIYQFGISPNKLLDYMMGGKPVIHVVPVGNDLVAESGCGISIRALNADLIADAIKQMMAMSPQERELLGENGRKFVRDHHDYKALAQSYLKAVENQAHVIK
jgi:glycosyltransferase involved in cell wall biosynthesis